MSSYARVLSALLVLSVSIGISSAGAAVTAREPASVWTSAGLVHAPGGLFLRDRFGRRLQLHGVNLVAKCGGGATPAAAPGTPCVGSARGPQPAFVLTPTAKDPGRRFTAADARTLAALGFDSVRLGIIWQGLEPGPAGVGPNDPRYCAPHAAGTPFPALGSADPYRASDVRAYLAKTDRIVRLLRAVGIRSLIDMHQDAYGSAFNNASAKLPWNGEGAPPWATCTDGRPLSHPAGWQSTYGDPVGVAAIHHFFQNDVRGNLQGQFARVWRAVARHFRGNSAVIGYDVYNEPADVSSPALDRELECLYGGAIVAPASCRSSGAQGVGRGLIGAIQSVDRSHVVFYEPGVFTDFGNAETVGITHPLPFGNIGMAFHIYAAQTALAKVLGERRRTRTKQPGGPALYLDEFGATPNAKENDATTAFIEASFVSWSYWSGFQFHDPTGKPGEGMLAEQSRRPYPAQATALARAYPAATAGTPTQQAYASSTGVFRFGYRVDHSVHAPTLISLPHHAYPHGYRVTVTGATVASPAGAHLLALSAGPHAGTVHVTVRRR